MATMQLGKYSITNIFGGSPAIYPVWTGTTAAERKASWQGTGICLTSTYNYVEVGVGSEMRKLLPALFMNKSGEM